MPVRTFEPASRLQIPEGGEEILLDEPDPYCVTTFGK